MWILAFDGKASAETVYVPARLTPPEPDREFRAAWIATLKNIDWPSRPGLPVAEQKAELIAMLDAAARLRLNAVLLQVRTACDALYPSTIEPWSEYLTGRMGQPPAPFYDPLAFAVEQAHQRGLELHAWFNPYRARHNSAFSPISPNHISKARPDLVRSYSNLLWLDPGNREVQEYSARVVFDVVQRYDIDGVHFDDYFYPYPEKDGRQQSLPFPDGVTWSKYRESGGKLDRDSWRRENVNQFLRRVATGIKQRKPWVKFGISPFGIWRPGFPSVVKGLDAYTYLYADSRRWLTEGLCDYLAPQLYWSTARREQSFPVLLDWWAHQNILNRHVWPGLALNNGTEEITNQIRLARRQSGVDGQLHWSMKVLTQNRNGLADVLARDIYTRPALVPAFPWLNPNPIPIPELQANSQADGSVRFSWRRADSTNSWRWVVQRRMQGRWTTDFLSGTHQASVLSGPQCPEAIVVRSVDRYGRLSSPTALQRQAEPAATSTAPAAPIPSPAKTSVP